MKHVDNVIVVFVHSLVSNLWQTVISEVQSIAMLHLILYKWETLKLKLHFAKILCTLIDQHIKQILVKQIHTLRSCLLLVQYSHGHNWPYAHLCACHSKIFYSNHLWSWVGLIAISPVLPANTQLRQFSALETSCRGHRVSVAHEQQILWPSAIWEIVWRICQPSKAKYQWVSASHARSKKTARILGKWPNVLSPVPQAWECMSNFLLPFDELWPRTIWSYHPNDGRLNSTSCLLIGVHMHRQYFTQRPQNMHVSL